MKPRQTGGERKIKAEVMDDGWTQQRQDSSSQEVKSVSSQFSPRACSTGELRSIHRAEDGQASDSRQQRREGGYTELTEEKTRCPSTRLRRTKKAIEGITLGLQGESARTAECWGRARHEERNGKRRR